MKGAFVISLDFELYWGVRDRHAINSPYAARLHGAREVIPRILDLFTEFDIAATWATVGLLYGRSADHLRDYLPTVRPTYKDHRLDPYHEPIGPSEEDDPLRLAPSLIQRIRETPRQEIATHTFGHYYCGEPGQTREQFEADLLSAVRIAEAAGDHIASIVYPRNQHNHAYVDVLRAAGIRAYRGNPDSWMWRFENTGGSDNRLLRLGRLIDSYISLSGDGSTGWDEHEGDAGLVNIPSSALLRPYDSSRRYLEALRLRRITRAMTSAANRRRIYHLWWHPHNMGGDLDENLVFLRAVLEHFARLRDECGMESLTMAEIADRVLAPSSARQYETTRSGVNA